MLNDQQLDLIPDDLLAIPNTEKLRRFLGNRGWCMSLLELDQERRRRGITPRKQRWSRDA